MPLLLPVISAKKDKPSAVGSEYGTALWQKATDNLQETDTVRWTQNNFEWYYFTFNHLNNKGLSTGDLTLTNIHEEKGQI